MKSTLIILAVFAVFAVSLTQGAATICPTVGYFQDVQDCKSYNLCYFESGKLENIRFTCPKGKAYDHINGYCSRDVFENCKSQNHLV